jgi:hypothetical protein
VRSAIPPRASLLALCLGFVVGALGCSGGTLDVPYLRFSGYLDDKGVRSTLAGIEVTPGEARPWVEDRVLLVFSNRARVDPDGPVLVSDGQRIAIGDSFGTNPPIVLVGGFDCGGKRWERALHLPVAPTLLP